MRCSRAPLERTDNGLRPTGEGWFVVNVFATPAGSRAPGLGRYGLFDSEEARLQQVGIGIGILLPGEPNCMYHAEEAQEDFLVLAGECLLIVEGEERLLRAWDFVHCSGVDRARLRGSRRRPVSGHRRGCATKGKGPALPRQPDGVEVRRRGRGGDVRSERADTPASPRTSPTRAPTTSQQGDHSELITGLISRIARP